MPYFSLSKNCSPPTPKLVSCAWPSHREDSVHRVVGEAEVEVVLVLVVLVLVVLPPLLDVLVLEEKSDDEDDDEMGRKGVGGRTNKGCRTTNDMTTLGNNNNTSATYKHDRHAIMMFLIFFLAVE